MINKIVKLVLDEDSLLGGIDAVALVESPAIEEEFMIFSKQEFESYNDYPQAAIEAAKQGIKRNEATGNKCATQVGKVRAQQLANGEPVSLDTIRRMRAFLIRQKDNYELQRDRKSYDSCGYISYLLWGGPAALPWAEKKLRQACEEFVNEEYNDLEDACQPGYIAYGLKRKNGRLVPNCVPKQNFNELLLQEIIEHELKSQAPDLFRESEEIDGTPTFTTIEEAEAKALELGCEGYHEHTLESGEVVYMPCSTHEDTFELDVTGLPTYINEVSSSYSFSDLDEKQMLIGPLMTPNKLIARRDNAGEMYHVYFDEETIEKLAYKTMEDKLNDKVNIEHNQNEMVDGVYLVESWLVKDPKKDKSNYYGYTPVKGQWFGMYKVKNKAVWDEYVKTGKVKGFSVEGYFAEKLDQYASTQS